VTREIDRAEREVKALEAEADGLRKRWYEADKLIINGRFCPTLRAGFARRRGAAAEAEFDRNKAAQINAIDERGNDVAGQSRGSAKSPKRQGRKRPQLKRKCPTFLPHATPSSRTTLWRPIMPGLMPTNGRPQSAEGRRRAGACPITQSERGVRDAIQARIDEAKAPVAAGQRR
jgi:hypothetical protein